jgi:hypothetical protein
MIEEPILRIGILQGYSEVAGRLDGPFMINDARSLSGKFSAHVREGRILLTDAAGHDIIYEKEVRCTPLDNSTFTLLEVTIGVNFHWERKQEQTFHGELRLILNENDTLIAVNRIPLEDYLSSVVSSEMNTEAELEFLKAMQLRHVAGSCPCWERQAKQDVQKMHRPAQPSKPKSLSGITIGLTIRFLMSVRMIIARGIRASPS